MESPTNTGSVARLGSARVARLASPRNAASIRQTLHLLLRRAARVRKVKPLMSHFGARAPFEE